MKHRILAAGIAGLFLALGAADAAAEGFSGSGGGFTGPGSETVVTTIDAAAKLPDHSPVTLRGKIVRALGRGRDNYLFRDATGEVVVDIDWYVWNGLSVNENDLVEIFGFVDKEGWRIEEIEVKSIKKL